MRSQIFVAALSASTVSAHGLVTSIQGANGVTMPGLSVADGTPRDCSSNGCGSQADTAIIRDREIQSGRCGPLGRTQGNGPIDAATMVGAFMAGGAAPTNNGTGVGEEDNIPNNAASTSGNGRTGNGRNAASNRNNDKREAETFGQFVTRQLGGLLSGLTGGGLAGSGGTKAEGPPESGVKAATGAGASQGLPTCADDGTISMTFRQINQDGAGPMEAAVDGTSGGTQASAFQNAKVTKDVPGLGIQGLSLATSTEFPLEVQMPAGMTCEGTVAGVDNVCVVRVRNGAGAGPFGGSAAFTQSAAARKRAIAYRLKKRMELNNRA